LITTSSYKLPRVKDLPTNVSQRESSLYWVNGTAIPTIMKRGISKIVGIAMAETS